jgi:hypothetical protein
MASRTNAGAGRPPRRPEAGRRLDLIPDLVWSLLIESRAERPEDDELLADLERWSWGPEAWTEQPGGSAK